MNRRRGIKSIVCSSQEQLTQTLHHSKKELKQFAEKSDQQIHQYKSRIDQLEKENEQLKREEIVHVEPSTTTDIQTLTVNNEEREQFENEIERLKYVIQSYEGKEREWKEKLTKQMQEKENEFERVKHVRDYPDHHHHQSLIYILFRRKINKSKSKNPLFE